MKTFYRPSRLLQIGVEVLKGNHKQTRHCSEVWAKVANINNSIFYFINKYTSSASLRIKGLDCAFFLFYFFGLCWYPCVCVGECIFINFSLKHFDLLFHFCIIKQFVTLYNKLYSSTFTTMPFRTCKNQKII